MGAGRGWWEGERFKIVAAHFLRVVSMVEAGCSKTARYWRMAALESRTAPFVNRRPHTRSSSTVIHRTVFPAYYSKKGTTCWVIAHVEIQMANNNNNNNNNKKEA